MTKGNTGFSLVEISIVMALMSILAASIIPMAIHEVQKRAAQKTAKEILFIQDAARAYFKKEKYWPNSFDELRKEDFINSQWDLLNPWNNPYQISLQENRLNISTDVPIDWVKFVASFLPASEINGTFISSPILTVEQLSGIYPGVIVAWSGTIAEIPQGWVLCNGENGTPDLQDKFIVGAKKSDDPRETSQTYVSGEWTKQGGMDVTRTEEHVLTIDQMPRHQHDSWGEAFSEIAPWGASGNRNNYGGKDSDWDNYFYKTSPTGGSQGHSHAISVKNRLPPYYALAFIMKV